VRRALALAIVVTAVAVTVAGCGGSSSSSSPPPPPPPPPPPASTGATGTGGAARVTSEQWQTYEAANAAWLKVTNEAIATFRHCTQITAASNANSDKMKACLGSTATDVAAANRTFAETLHSFHTGGACSSALNDYIGGLVSWNNVVAGIQHAVSLGQLPSTANAPTAFNEIGTSAKAFVKSCKPIA
jgi:hypothetical protein